MGTRAALGVLTVAGVLIFALYAAHLASPCTPEAAHESFILGGAPTTNGDDSPYSPAGEPLMHCLRN